MNAVTPQPTHVHTGPDFHRGFEGLHDEYSYWVRPTRGRIPDDLQGTLFRNGPGTMTRGERQYGHWFDGPGMINAVTFFEGKAHYKNRYVRTPKYVQEAAADKILFRGFGTQREGNWLNNIGRLPSNPANTNLFYHAGKLGAYYEGGQPYQLDPGTLDTIGLDFLNGALNRNKFISAHGKINYRTGHFINFGVSVTGIGLKGLVYTLEVHDFDSSGQQLNSCRIRLDEFPFLHDFAVTENHAVVIVSSVGIGMLKPMLGLCALGDVMHYKVKDCMQGYVIDLRSMSVVKRFELDPGVVVHFGNAYERGDELVTEFMYTTDTANFYGLSDVLKAKSIKGAPLNRCTINLKTGQVRQESLDELPLGEFPAWDARETCYPTRHSYWVSPVPVAEAGNKPVFYNAVVKFDHDSGDCELHDFGPHRFTSEALFIPRKGSTADDDGYLASFVYDATRHKTDVVLLDAGNLHNEIACLSLSHHVPFGFHGHYTEQVFLNS